MDSKEHKLEVADNTTNCPQRMNTGSSQNWSLNGPSPPQNTRELKMKRVENIKKTV